MMALMYQTICCTAVGKVSTGTALTHTRARTMMLMKEKGNTSKRKVIRDKKSFLWAN